MRIDEVKQAVLEEVKRLEEQGLHQAAKQYASENTITEQRELEIRAALNGHSSLESGRIYLTRTAKKQAHEIRQKMQATLTNKAESGSYVT